MISAIRRRILTAVLALIASASVFVVSVGPARGAPDRVDVRRAEGGGGCRHRLLAATERALRRLHGNGVDAAEHRV